MDKFAKTRLSVQVFPVTGDILRDEDQFGDVTEPFRFPYKVIHGFGTIFPADGRDQAVRAPVVASVGDFQISVMKRGRYHPFLSFENLLFPPDVIDAFSPIRLFDRFGQKVVIVGAEKNVYLGQFFEHIVHEFLRHAARHHDLFEFPVFPVSVALENRIEGFFSCRFEKGTGIDHDDLRFA